MEVWGLRREDLRNVAIVAHVDHGKTTLVDQMLKQGGCFRDNQVVEERVMDSNDLEKERGITILAKNTSAYYKGTKINIIDTPGHADFGGEVERILKMVNGVILLVDSADGPMPQTRFVLKKSLELGHRIIVVVNKIDRPDARFGEVEDEILELLLDLDATSEQLDSPMLYCSGREGTAEFSPYKEGKNLNPLFDTILEYIEPPEGDADAPLQMLVSSIDYNDYVGRIAVGRIERGTLKQNQNVSVCNFHGNTETYTGKATNIYQIEGLLRTSVSEASVGDIVCLSGLENITIGDTLCSVDNAEPLPFVKISEPTIEMTFSVNNGPFAGKEGKFVTSRQLRDYLFKETLKDVSLRVYETESTDSFKVCGRGEMHLSILMENMRRAGYEFMVSTPKVLYKEIDGVTHEPMELVTIDLPSDYVGTVMNKLGSRKGEMLNMTPIGETRMKVEFKVPSRGLFGYKNEFLTDTRGEGVYNTLFAGYEPFKGEISRRTTGSLVAFETGESVTYGLYNAQERGTLFIEAGVPVYEGMIVGVSPKTDDINVNVCKKKQLTNTRASGSDDALKLIPCKKMSLEEAIEFISEDELIEITPENIRLRKSILDNGLRAKARNKK